MKKAVFFYGVISALLAAQDAYADMSELISELQDTSKNGQTITGGEITIGREQHDVYIKDVYDGGNTLADGVVTIVDGTSGAIGNSNYFMRLDNVLGTGSPLNIKNFGFSGFETIGQQIDYAGNIFSTGGVINIGNLARLGDLSNVSFSENVINISIDDATGDSAPSWDGSLRGAAIYNEGVMGNIESSYFMSNSINASAEGSNSALVYGGAIANNGEMGEIKDSEFVKNSITAVQKLSENNVNVYGGALANMGTLSGLSNVNFEENKINIANNAVYVEGFGGALYSDGDIESMTSIIFRQNGVEVSSNSNDMPLSGEGGAISARGYINSMKNVEFYDNYVKVASDNNPYSQGGALYLFNMKNVVQITNSIFDGNNVYAKSPSGSATAQGGAILSSSKGLNLLNTSFRNNFAMAEASSSATAQGGAIYSEVDVNIKATDSNISEFVGNKVKTVVDGVTTETANDIYIRGFSGFDIALTLETATNGSIRFDGGIDGINYDINIKGDGTGSVDFNGSLTNYDSITIDNAVVNFGSTASSTEITNLSSNGVINNYSQDLRFMDALNFNGDYNQYDGQSKVDNQFVSGRC